MADKEHVERLKRSVEEWNAWRREHPEIRPDLSSAKINNIHLRWADLSRTNLRRTKLVGSYLDYTDFSFADLRGADLSFAYLKGTILDGANLTGTYFSDTTFAEVDLDRAKGLEATIHNSRSYIDINSVALPRDEPTRLHFLRGVGFSDTAIEYLPSILAPTALQYYSLFVSYAKPDEALAHRLYQDLQSKGVRCWMAPHDLRPGDYHHSRIDEAIRLQEKVLLLLSEHAVNSSWVKHEVQVALAREVAQDCTVLFPLRLDEIVVHTSKDWAVQLRESRHIGDFTGWQDEAAYQQAFATLLQHLKVTKPPTA